MTDFGPASSDLPGLGWPSAIAGMMGVASMLLVLAVLAPREGRTVVAYLAAMAGSAAAGVIVLPVGGVLLGLLHGACQQRGPGWAYALAGGFYGVAICVVGSVVMGLLGFDGSTLRTGPWLAACVAFGLTLAFGVWTAARFAPPPPAAVAD